MLETPIELDMEEKLVTLDHKGIQNPMNQSIKVVIEEVIVEEKSLIVVGEEEETTKVEDPTLKL